MNINLNPSQAPISTASTVLPQLNTVAGSSSKIPFAELVQNAVHQVDSEQQNVATSIEKLAAGEVNNLQAITADIARADLSFRFLMEVRNRLISSYQEIMRMQV